MKLEGKQVWELSLDEIEYIYKYRHMNHYVYAALKTYHTSCPPLNRPVSLRPNTIPPYLRAITEKLLEFSPQIGHEDPSYVRAGITFYTYNLYTVLDQVQLEDVPLVVQLLSAFAYLSIYSEKNDKLPLWKYQVIRVKNNHINLHVKMLQKSKVDVKRIINAIWVDAKRYNEAYADLMELYNFVLRSMYSIIVCMENGDAPLLIERALLNTERAMLEYEQRHGFLDPSSPVHLKNPNNIRYRNALYLYGGMFFERQGWLDRATQWYLKDIYDPALPRLLDVAYLRSFKITERLLSAYGITSDKEIKRDLKDLIDRSFVAAFQRTAAYAYEVINFFQTHSDNDVMTVGPIRNSSGELIHYAGEGSREVYFCSLLYNKFVLGIDYPDIEYARFFNY